MNITPIRHMLFLAVLLFIILSSGSLQCALNCYDRVSQNSLGTTMVADCHPLAIAQLSQSPVCDFCHYGHSQSNIEREPVLQSIGGGQFLALLTPRSETPEYRSGEPISHTFAVLTLNTQTIPESLPLSQNLKQLRSTILLV
jgi:hypothetical protein